MNTGTRQIQKPQSHLKSFKDFCLLSKQGLGLQLHRPEIVISVSSAWAQRAYGAGGTAVAVTAVLAGARSL